MSDKITTGAAAQMLRLRGVKVTHKAVIAACYELDIKLVTEQHGKRKVYLIEYSYNLSERLYEYFKNRPQQPENIDRYALLAEYRKARCEQAAHVASHGTGPTNDTDRKAYSAHKEVVRDLPIYGRETAKWRAARNIVDDMAWVQGYYAASCDPDEQAYAQTYVAACEAALAAII